MVKAWHSSKGSTVHGVNWEMALSYSSGIAARLYLYEWLMSRVPSFLVNGCSELDKGCLRGECIVRINRSNSLNDGLRRVAGFPDLDRLNNLSG